MAIRDGMAVAKNDPAEMADLYAAICRLMAASDGNSPSLAAIADEMGYSSTGVVRNRLKQLEKTGAIIVGSGNSIKIPGSVFLLPSELDEIRQRTGFDILEIVGGE